MKHRKIDVSQYSNYELLQAGLEIDKIIAQRKKEFMTPTQISQKVEGCHGGTINKVLISMGLQESVDVYNVGKSLMLTDKGREFGEQFAVELIKRPKECLEGTLDYAHLQHLVYEGEDRWDNYTWEGAYRYCIRWKESLIPVLQEFLVNNA